MQQNWGEEYLAGHWPNISNQSDFLRLSVCSLFICFSPNLKSWNFILCLNYWDDHNLPKTFLRGVYNVYLCICDYLYKSDLDIMDLSLILSWQCMHGELCMLRWAFALDEVIMHQDWGIGNIIVIINQVLWWMYAVVRCVAQKLPPLISALQMMLSSFSSALKCCVHPRNNTPTDVSLFRILFQQEMFANRYYNWPFSHIWWHKGPRKSTQSALVYWLNMKVLALFIFWTDISAALKRSGIWKLLRHQH